MTSKIVVNNIEADSGINTVTFNSNISGNFVGNVNTTGVSTFSNIRVTGGTISGVSTAGITTIYIGAGSSTTPSISPTGDSDCGIYFPAANTVAISTGGVESARFDSSGNFKFNSGYGVAETAYGCRAWVNFNGTGVVDKRASGNVTSITDNGTGDYTVNFTTAMPDANYAANVGSGNNAGSGLGAWTTVYSVATATASSFRIGAYSSGGSNQDQDQVMCAIFR